LEQTIVGIDVGTTKVCTLVAERTGSGQLSVVGVGVAPSRGLRKGVVTDVDAAAAAIGESVRKAERVSGRSITRAYVSIGGSHITSMNSTGVVATGKGERPIDREDVDRAFEQANAVSLEHNRRVIFALARGFNVDGNDGVRNPVGLLGYRLQVNTHLVTGSATCIQNLVKCIEANEIEVIQLVPQPLASAEAVMEEDEREIGAAIVDLGGGTTDLAIFTDGAIRETCVLPVGGHHFTNDIAVGLSTPLATAEDIKLRYGRTDVRGVGTDERIEVLTFGEQSLTSISRRELCSIVAARAEETADLVGREIARAGCWDKLPAGIILTGGTSCLHGLRETVQDHLGMPVRVGLPKRLSGLVETISGPQYATAVGLLLWADREESRREQEQPGPIKKSSLMRTLMEFIRRVFMP